MTELAVSVIGAHAEPYAATPTLMLRLRLEETTGAKVHSIALRAQIRIEPQRRLYSKEDERNLVELFGSPAQWSDTLRPFLWTHLSTVVTGFTASTEVDLAMPCTYDFEVAASKYLHSLGGGDIPIVALFNGTVFTAGPQGVQVEPVAWHTESEYRLPVQVWRDVMDAYFPNSGWLRVRRDVLDSLQGFKAARGMLTWEEAFQTLLKEAGVDG